MVGRGACKLVALQKRFNLLHSSLGPNLKKIMAKTNKQYVLFVLYRVILVLYNQFYPKMFYIVLYDKFLQADKILMFITWQRLSPLPQE